MEGRACEEVCLGLLSVCGTCAHVCAGCCIEEIHINCSAGPTCNYMWEATYVCTTKPCKSLMTLESMPLYVKPYLLTDITLERQEGIGEYQFVGDHEFG